jgi:hypothetical protein
MKTIIRNNSEEAVMIFVSKKEETSIYNISLKYKHNVDDDWVLATIKSSDIKCCGYVISVTIDTTPIKDGSMFVKLEHNGTKTAIEEYVLLTEAEEIVSNYNGVKITNG